MATTLTINATPLTAYLALGWTIQRTLNGIGVFTGEILSADGVYHMDLDQLTEVIDTTHGVILFGAGDVVRGTRPGSRRPHGLSNPVHRERFQCLCESAVYHHGHSGRKPQGGADGHRGLHHAGGLHVSQVNGPTLPALSYVNMKGVDVLNDLSIQSGGWLWNVNDNQVLRMEAPTTNTAPFDIVAGVGVKPSGTLPSSHA
jgi:hypothetical protein